MSEASSSTARLRRGLADLTLTTTSRPAVPSFAPTDLVPESGLPAWAEPDPASAPAARLDPGLPVRVTERWANGWAHVACSNGWSAWVDGRLLVPMDAPADDELRSALGTALAEYGQLVDQLDAGTIDQATFSRRALGVGLVVRESEAWILDPLSRRWWPYDGMSLSSATPAPAG